MGLRLVSRLSVSWMTGAAELSELAVVRSILLCVAVSWWRCVSMHRVFGYAQHHDDVEGRGSALTFVAVPLPVEPKVT